MALPDVKLAGEPAMDPCSDAVVQAALDAGDDGATVAAFGGGEAFRAAVAAGNAPCISLSDPAREWVVVNKLRPLEPVDFAPASVVASNLPATTRSTRMRPAVADALGRLAAQSQAVGAGRLPGGGVYVKLPFASVVTVASGVPSPLRSICTVTPATPAPEPAAAAT